jgi:hypothetical protein
VACDRSTVCYRTTLKRQGAIKVSPESLPSDADRPARFDAPREDLREPESLRLVEAGRPVTNRRLKGNWRDAMNWTLGLPRKEVFNGLIRLKCGPQ